MTSSSSVMTAPNGNRRIMQTDFYHCEICKSFVRRKDRNRGALLETDENFTPQAKNIWRAYLKRMKILPPRRKISGGRYPEIFSSKFSTRYGVFDAAI